ncbi:hypothetical protein [Allocoleopsis sp.]
MSAACIVLSFRAIALLVIISKSHTRGSGMETLQQTDVKRKASV